MADEYFPDLVCDALGTTATTAVTGESGIATPIDLVRFLRDVIAVSGRHRTTVAAQTQEGFALWCDSEIDISGVSSPYLESPAAGSPVILQVKKPDSTPPRSPVSETAADRKRYEKALADWTRHRSVYEHLFAAIHPADGMELVWSSTLVEGADENGTQFSRHILAAAAVVDLDIQTGLLTVRAASSAQMETSWLPPARLGNLLKAQTHLDGLSACQTRSDLDTQLRRLINALGPSAHAAAAARRTGSNGMSLSASHAILLRKRESSALLRILDEMEKDFTAGGRIPEPFRMIADPGHHPVARPVLNEEPALALDANENQRKLVRRASTEAHVVIQGPPGTGKTHTIANLLSALLAEGRRVLVTAENERALQEVQGKLPKDMQSLLLPIFRDGGASSLGSSVNEIIQQSQTPPEKRSALIAKLSSELRDTQGLIDKARYDLMAIAARDREERCIGGVSMMLAGHLMHLSKEAQRLSYVDKFLSKTEHLDPAQAAALLDLSVVVTEAHQQLVDLTLPTEPVPAEKIQLTLRNITDELHNLPAARAHDYTTLSIAEHKLKALRDELLHLAPVPSLQIVGASELYAAAETRARLASTAIQYDLGVVNGDPHDIGVLRGIARVLEQMSMVNVPGEWSASELVKIYEDAVLAAPSGLRTPHFEPADPIGLRTDCEDVLLILDKDRTGLLDAYALESRSSGGAITEFIRALAGDPLLTEPSCPPVSVDPTAPPSHVLLRQARLLHDYLKSGGKLKARLTTPRATKEFSELLACVRIDGVEVATTEEAEWLVAWFEYQMKSADLMRRAEKASITIPVGVRLQEWVASVKELPWLYAAAVAEPLSAALAGRAPSAGQPYSAREALSDTSLDCATVLVERLKPLVDEYRLVAAEVRLDGHPVRGTEQAGAALSGVRARITRAEAHQVLPEVWRSGCDPFDTTPDLLVSRLQAAASVASIPGWARASEISAASLADIIEQVHADQRRSELRQDQEKLLSDAHTRLSVGASASPATRSAITALAEKDWSSYAEALSSLAMERQHVAMVASAKAARTAVERTHPRLLLAYDLGDTVAAEVLLQINDYEELRDYQESVTAWKGSIGDAAACHVRLADLHSRYRKAEQKLASARCWEQAAARLVDQPKLASALSALSTVVAKVPKTKTARSYPSALRAVQERTKEAAPAIPAWVLSIDQAAELLGYPPPEDRFDVIIVDEASQAWFPSMFLYALADQVIVVGDDLQTSPSVNTGAEDQIRELANKHIRGHRLCSSVGDDLSLYDIASMMTAAAVMNDHFRCVPEIIEISNRLSYVPNGKALNPARVRRAGSLTPVLTRHVPGSRLTRASANTAEAEALCKAVRDCHADPRYKGLTFGVVVVGSNPTAHLREIRTGLLGLLGPAAIARRDLEIGTAAQFQGAERDVMFMSMLDAPPVGKRLTTRPLEHTGKNRRFVQQLNVAASRAKDQLWIFHSFTAADLSHGGASARDARLELISGAAPQTLSLASELEKCDSKFERDVVEAIHALDPDLRIQTQVEALGYQIDVVVESADGRRLAVECDGDRWHTEDSDVRADLYRQRALEGIGWRFHRFLASEWYAAPQVHAKAILAAL